MSRRVANPAADRAAQNQQTIKSLLKLEGNKSCADCKRNKHPRWASWNLGIFVCIRCSGIHRGMGTHISRVKSVDLDAWTDEQLQSVLKWGNARANKYWEAKLAPGHVPSEAKIENFIRTKYESKRWVMEGPIPDPSTLDTEGDDDVEKAKLDRSSSQRNASSSSQPAMPVVRAAPNVNLFDDDIPAPPARPNTADSQSVRPPPAKPTNHSQLLGGLDFLGEPPDRPASASSKPQGSTGPSRPDLKQSILSLYATAPRSQPQNSSSPPHVRQSSFGGMQSPPTQQPSAFGGLDDAFAGLTFATPTSPSAPQAQQRPIASSFASFGQTSSQRSTPAPPLVTSTPLSGGGFFDTNPKPPPKPAASTRTKSNPPHALRKISNASSGFGEFSSALTPISASSMATSGNGLLDLSSPQSTTSAKSINPPANVTSAFNLSAPKPAPQYQQVVQSSAPPIQSNSSSFSAADAWGSNDPWATAEPSVQTPRVKAMKTPTTGSANASDFGWGNPTSNNNGITNATKSPSVSSATTNDFGWGNSPSTNSGVGGFNGNGFSMPSPAKGFGVERPSAPPTITADEDFGGWNSAAPETPAASVPSAAKSSSQAGKPSGGFASDDLWSNVWQ